MRRISTPLAAAVTVDVDTAQLSSWVDVSLLHRLTFMLHGTLTGVPGTLTTTVEVSNESAAALNSPDSVGDLKPSDPLIITYDKLIGPAGVSTPAQAVVLSTTSGAVFSTSLEDSIRSLRIRYIAATGSEGNEWDFSCWLVGDEIGAGT